MGQSVTTLSDAKKTVDFTINGVSYTVSENVPSDTSLNVFIRDHAKLRGTKAMCHEGGCGACIVSAEIKGQTLAVNSCLVPVLICNGWVIKTIEGIGNKKDGYHSIQASLAEMNGSQCGYCSPGMVMNLYSLLQDNKLTMKEIENSFGSNICRCTGYRPILDTFKAYATDATPKLAKRIQDIEDAYMITKTCPKSGLKCKGDCNSDKKTVENYQSKPVYIQMKDAEFYKVTSIVDLFNIFTNKPSDSYLLHGGNTAHGVYRCKKPQLYIDINDLPDLHRVQKEKDSLVLGGNVTLTTAKENFEKFSKDPGFEYLRHLADHLDLVASIPVRNIGSIAGNLMIKHQYREFPSDVFLMLETCGAQIHVLDGPSNKNSMTLLQFLNTDMKRKIIYSIVLPALSHEYEYRSYKIMPRAQNAHAHVNAGFLFKLDGAGKVLEKPNIIIGGIKPDFLHATQTEEYLMGKSILDKKTFAEAMKKLDSELEPDHVLPDYSPKFRKRLAEGLFYKFVLSIKPESIDPKLRSGADLLKRGLSSGTQDYETDKSVWPVNKPIPKLESIYQTSGEGQYVNDIPPQPNEVFCAFVHTTVANGKLESVDPKEALEMDGVVAFFTAKDVPGKNLFVSGADKFLMLESDELIFVEEDISYAGQPIGVIAATTHARANEAAQKVKVTYKDALKKKPVITIENAIASNDKTRFLQTANFPAQTKGKDTKHIIKGTFSCGSQYHYTMEPQSCVCIPIEDGMDVYPASQYISHVEARIADCLNVKNNSININVRRLGGAYGAKISRTTQVVCACAVVCHKLNRPARFIMSIESNMIAMGKRYATRQEYEIGVDDDGKIQYLNSKHWGNSGASFNELHAPFVIHHMYSCYDKTTWSCDGFETRTDIPSNTYCRAPGSTEGIALAENMMEHIAQTVGKDPVAVKLLNMNEDDKKNLEPMIDELIKTSDFNMRKRAVEAFNNENRWKKKGISLVPMKYPLMYWGQYQALVSIHARDGTVTVTHGGIECGQGIHTKVTQVAAHTLGIDLNLVLVKPSSNLTSPNNSVTGGSVASEACSYATMMACKELLNRLEPIKQELGGNPTWKELVLTACNKDIDLCARYMFTTKDDPKPYSIYGVTIAEVELDILTGQHLVNRIDLIEDAGVSLNPSVDLGQVEGAFVMGMGYWTSEDLIYHPDTGELTNHRTWNYKPPGAKDIPIDFRVTFRRNAPNPLGVLRSKATGEPPLCMTCVIPFAIRNALNSARKDSGDNTPWLSLDGPVTMEKILLSSSTDINQMVLEI